MARPPCVRLRAEVADFKNKMRDAEQSTGKLGQAVKRNEASMRTAGTALAVFGAGATAVATANAKAAIDWESAWAGVTKTVDGTTGQMAALEEGLRGMARELPATHDEIASVAEAAGQLGIETSAVEGFTQTMLDLGETTNLTADQAATALARFGNVMGTSQQDFDRLGSTIVELGNNYATTEAEIVDMSQRLAGAGRQAGLTEGEVMGLATSLSSVGIEAQAGGTAFSRVMIEMGTAAENGTEELATFAEVAGMTADQFATAWREDAGGAIAAFVAGLGEMEASGQSIQPILEELGMTDIRVGDALRRASGAADMFTEAMGTGNDAWAENTALAAEAEKRYGTTAAQIDIARNNIVDAAISMGEVFLPVIAEGSELVSVFASTVADLPKPLRDTVGALGGVAGAASLAGGAFLIATPAAVDTYRAFQQLGVIGPRTSRAIRGVAGALTGPWGLAIAGATVAAGLWMKSQADAAAQVEAHTDALKDQGGQLGDLNRELIQTELISSGAAEAADELGVSLPTMVDAAMGSADAQAELNEQLAEARERLDALIEGSMGYGPAAGDMRGALS